MSFVICFTQISTLQDFFKDETVFVAYGSERCSVDDFELSGNGKIMSYITVLLHNHVAVESYIGLDTAVC